MAGWGQDRDLPGGAQGAPCQQQPTQAWGQGQKSLPEALGLPTKTSHGGWRLEERQDSGRTSPRGQKAGVWMDDKGCREPRAGLAVGLWNGERTPGCRGLAWPQGVREPELSLVNPQRAETAEIHQAGPSDSAAAASIGLFWGVVLFLTTSVIKSRIMNHPK